MELDQEATLPKDRLFELSTNLLGTASEDGYFTLLNPAWVDALGWSVEELLAAPYASFVHPDDRAATLKSLIELSQPLAVDVTRFENRCRTKEGGYRWLQWTARATADELYFVVRDCTDEREDRARREHQNDELRESQDLVSGLTNSIAEGIFTVNHGGRATYLNAAAQKMLGWSEGELLGSKIHDVIHCERPDRTDFPIEDCPIVNTVNSGATVRMERDYFVRRDGTRFAVSYSSSPLHHDGTIGSVVVFDDISERLASETRAEREIDKLSWIGRINDALAQDRFTLFAQPIMDLRTEEVTQHELLIRMLDVNGSVILPGRFLPTAEEYGLTLDIDRWVVEQSARIAATGHKVEFNLSARSLGLAMVNTIADAIRTFGAPPENLVCEITETALMNDNAAGELFVSKLRELGCRIALDDFGIGYGGLGYLKRLPVSYLKIDTQFVSDLVQTESSRHVVRAIVDLAQGFGAQTIAEGAEDDETVRVLKELGVDFVQGYVIARPGPVEQMLATP